MDQSVFRTFLSEDEIIYPTSAEYASKTEVWSIQKSGDPQVVFQPTSLASLQNTVRYLCESDLDFAVRSGGIGSSSAKDVVLSMSAFDGFEYDSASETVVIGSGQTWGDVNRKVQEVAPEFSALSTRVPFLGVGGSILGGGISWLSGEHGLCSDPKTLLDVQVVLPDGRLIWASTEPDLLWALRGGGGNFGVATAFKIKIYRCSQNILAGNIIFPKSSLEALSRGISQFSQRYEDPKLAFHAVIMDFEGSAMRGEIADPGIGLVIYDAHGEEHGRGELGFKWAFDIEGAIDMTKVMNTREVVGAAAGFSAGKGINSSLSSALVDAVDPEFLVRIYKWVENAMKANPALAAGTFGLLELMGKNTFMSSGGSTMTAWPHNSQKHILQLSTGYLPGADCDSELALEILEKGPSEISPCHTPADFWPVFIQKYHDLSLIFGPNYERLRQIKTRYDPKERLNKGTFIPSL